VPEIFHYHILSVFLPVMFGNHLDLAIGIERTQSVIESANSLVGITSYSIPLIFLFYVCNTCTLSWTVQPRTPFHDV
jgi:hypothetical protein